MYEYPVKVNEPYVENYDRIRLTAGAYGVRYDGAFWVGRRKVATHSCIKTDEFLDIEMWAHVATMRKLLKSLEEQKFQLRVRFLDEDPTPGWWKRKSWVVSRDALWFVVFILVGGFLFFTGLSVWLSM